MEQPLHTPTSSLRATTRLQSVQTGLRVCERESWADASLLLPAQLIQNVGNVRWLYVDGGCSGLDNQS